MKRALIENDSYLSDQYDDFIEKYNLKEDLTDFFDVIVLDASDNGAAAIQAVVGCDEIWCDTCFVSSAMDVLKTLLHYAIQKGIKDKVIINMTPFSDVAWFLDDEAKELIYKVKQENNIQFIYSDKAEYKQYLPKLN